MSDIPLEQIDETIYLMEKRLCEGQGGVQDAMCRLSLRMALALRENLRSEISYLRNLLKEAGWYVDAPGSKKPGSNLQQRIGKALLLERGRGR